MNKSDEISDLDDNIEEIYLDDNSSDESNEKEESEDEIDLDLKKF